MGGVGKDFGDKFGWGGVNWEVMSGWNLEAVLQFSAEKLSFMSDRVLIKCNWAALADRLFAFRTA